MAKKREIDQESGQKIMHIFVYAYIYMYVYFFISYPFSPEILERMRTKSLDYASLLNSASNLSLYLSAFSMNLISIGRHRIEIEQRT